MNIATPVPFQCQVYMVLAPALLAEGLFHDREVIWQKAASTTAMSSERNFEKQFFTIPKTCELLLAPWQSRILHRMKNSRRMQTLADGGGRVKNNQFNTALSMTETTSVSLILLKHKRQDMLNVDITISREP